ncbi:MAG: hypothetical protein KF833_05375 [Verrucomicrobiae bacterium]|nr:hypothetical protein [Verrucomicrobiae bacterium]
METVSIGAIVGCGLGVLGGVVGTLYSIRNTNSPRERSFVIHAAILAWFTLGLTALAVFYLPTWRAWAWLPLCILVVVGGPLWNRRQ